MKIRIISAVIALAVIIPLIIIGGIPFACACGILAALGFKEIIDLKKSHQPYPNVVKVLGMFSLIYLILINYQRSIMTYNAILVPLVLILLPTIFYKKDQYKTNDALFLLGSIYLIGLFFNLLITIRNVNVNVLIYLLSISILTDTFAYAVGMLIGKHKITKISPNKSWEGFFAGLIGGSICGMIVYASLVAKLDIKIALVTILLSIVGQLGDLFYSKVKRENEIKDFSNIMPGHGGILDRVDSLSFIVFVYIILLWSI